MAQRFDRYPNFAVDTSGPVRIANLGRQNWGEVRQFFIDYQDRLMYGSDTVSIKSQLDLSDEEYMESFARFESACQLGRAYYGTDATIEVKGRKVRGLNLPKDVLEKLFFLNVWEWFPGIDT